MNSNLLFHVRRWMCLILLLSACTPAAKEITLTDVPVKVSRSNISDVDMEAVWEKVTEQVNQLLPGAYFQGIVFSGKHADLAQLGGKLVFVFVQVRFAFPNQQVVRAIVSVETNRQVMDIHIQDVSAFYPSTKRQTLRGLSVKQIAIIAHRHVAQLGYSGDVTLTQLEQFWSVRCGPLENLVQKCHFEIDSQSGEILHGASDSVDQSDQSRK